MNAGWRAAVLIILAVAACGGGSSHSDAAIADAKSADAPVIDATTPDAGCGPGGYPCGPYGVGVGSVITDLALSGKHDDDANGSLGDDTLRTLPLDRYRSQPGTEVIVLDLCAMWCVPCRTEQAALVTLAQMYAGAGNHVAFLSVLEENTAAGDPTEANLDTWNAQYHQPYDVLIDPGQTLAAYFASATPMFPDKVVIRASDMTITYNHDGVDTAGLQAAIDAVLAAP